MRRIYGKKKENLLSEGRLKIVIIQCKNNLGMHDGQTEKNNKVGRKRKAKKKKNTSHKNDLAASTNMRNYSTRKSREDNKSRLQTTIIVSLRDTSIVTLSRAIPRNHRHGITHATSYILMDVDRRGIYQRGRVSRMDNEQRCAYIVSSALRNCSRTVLQVDDYRWKC